MPNYWQDVADFKRHYLTDALIRAKGNISEAARTIQVHRNTFRRNCRELGIDVNVIYRKAWPARKRPSADHLQGKRSHPYRKVGSGAV